MVNKITLENINFNDLPSHLKGEMQEIDKNGKTKFQNLPQNLQDRFLNQMDAQQKELFINGNDTEEYEGQFVIEPEDDSATGELLEKEQIALYNKSEELQRKLDEETPDAEEIPADCPVDMDLPEVAEDTQIDTVPVPQYGQVPTLFSRIAKLFK